MYIIAIATYDKHVILTVHFSHCCYAR